MEIQRGYYQGSWALWLNKENPSFADNRETLGRLLAAAKIQLED